MGEDGVLLVDGDYSAWADAYVAALKEIDADELKARLDAGDDIEVEGHSLHDRRYVDVPDIVGD